MTDRSRIEDALAGLEANRALLGDAVVDTAQAALREQLAAMAPESTEAAQALKQVSVLFLDVVGSTSLAQHLGPEDIHEVMDGTLERCTEVVERHGGRVLQYAGDSMLAVFGADGTREDDAERAVRAGLGLLEVGRSAGAMVTERFEHAGFNVRVGVHTGGVLLGGGVDRENSIRGMTVNVAARLEQTAPPGTLRISQETLSHVRGRFDVDLQPPLQVKGRDEPLLSCLVMRERPRLFGDASRGIDEIATPMVGRDAELGRLQALHREVLRDGRARVALLLGEAGLGKSRVLSEFEQWHAGLAERGPVLRAQALPTGREQPYGLMRALFADAVGLSDGMGAAQGRDRFEAEIAKGLPPAGHPGHGADLGAAGAKAQAQVLGHLLGLGFDDSPHLEGLRERGRDLRQRAFHVGVQWLRAWVGMQRQPALLLLDDLHWADEGSLEFFARVQRATAGLPLLFVALARPTVLEPGAPWPAAPDNELTRIELAPLGPASSRELAATLLGRLHPAPTDLLNALTEHAAGNPYYLEETVRLLLDSGVIAADGASWTLRRERLDHLPLPGTLAGLLQARLDALASDEKSALQAAAVIGMRFWDHALAALAPEAPPALPALTRRELVHPQQASLAADLGEFRFHHQLLHAVTYGTVLRTIRRQHHLRAAAWLAALDTPAASRLLGEIAAHFEAGGDTLRAAEYYTRAAEHFADRYSHETVVTMAGRAMTLAPAEALALRFRTLHVRQRSLRVLGRMPEQFDDLQQLQALADALGDDRHLAAAALSRAVAAFSRGDPQGCVQLCEAAMQRARRAAAADIRAGLYSAWTGALRSLGSYDKLLPIAEEGLAFARDGGDRMHESELLATLAAVATDRGDAVRAQWLLRQSLAIDHEIGNTTTEVTTLINLGDAALRLGDFVAARRDLEAALLEAQTMGMRAFESVCRLNLGSVALFEGDAAQAESHASYARDVAASIGNTEYEAYAWMGLGHARLASRDLGGAEEAYRASRERLHAMDMAHLAVEADAGLARVALARGDVRAAGAEVEVVLEHLEQHNHLDGCEHPVWIRLTCWQVLREQRDPRAETQLRSAHEELTSAANRLPDEAARARYLAAVPYHREVMAAVQGRRPD